MKNILIGLGKIIIFISGLFLLIILMSKLILDFPNIDKTLTFYCILIGLGLIIIVMPEIKKLNIFNSGIEFQDQTLPGATGSKRITPYKNKK